MPRRAHRRCKEQGPTCLGITHPGFDICSRCLYDVVRPRMRAQKEAMRAKRTERLERERLSHENRTLISTVDLKEPQMAHAETDAYIWEAVEPVVERPTLAEVIHEVDLERKVDERIAKSGSAQQAFHEIIMEMSTDVPVIIDRLPEPLKKEDQPEPMPAPPVKRNSGKGGRVSKLSEEQWQEALDAYASGMSTKEICEAWSVNIGSLYARINRSGMPRRKDHMTKASSTVSHQVVEPAPTNGVVSGLTEWVVTYTVTRTESEKVYAKTFSQAAAAVEAKSPDFEIVSVAKVNH